MIFRLPSLSQPLHLQQRQHDDAQHPPPLSASNIHANRTIQLLTSAREMTSLVSEFSLGTASVPRSHRAFGHKSIFSAWVSPTSNDLLHPYSWACSPSLVVRRAMADQPKVREVDDRRSRRRRCIRVRPRAPRACWGFLRRGDGHWGAKGRVWRGTRDEAVRRLGEQMGLC
jgi:hypothetical protein